jgi:serine/threonine protein kinase
MADNLDGYFCETYGYKYPLRQKQSPTSRTEWRDHLISRGLMPDPLHELDWSGRGQHVEYEEQHEKDIPLIAERILGYSATAVVESVMCRRIRLARKSIKCTRRLTKVDYIAEVEHLHRLQHAHILRVVGTYTFKKGLAILLYPVASWNLDEFMDELLDTQSSVNSDVLQSGWRDRAGAKALRTAFGCLAHALHFIHNNNVKHMDFKPKNILVRAHGPETGSYKIYIADFGIARAYKSANDVETDSPIPFTRTYAAPEVAIQDTRGFSADIFSLGCVLLEMIATLISNPALNQRQRLADARTSESGDTSYHANLGAVQEWHRETAQNVSRGVVPLRIHDLTSSMMKHASHDRIATDSLDRELSDTFCSECYAGPEPFEVAEDLS